MRCLSPSRLAQILSTATILIAMAFSWAACFRDPAVGRMKCTTECPAGFACVNPDPRGPNGRCYPVGDGGTDTPGLVKEDGATPGRIDTVSIDDAQLDVVGPDSPHIEVGLPGSFDTSPIDGSSDQPLDSGTAGNDVREVGGQGGITGSGGGSGTGGVGGATGLGGLTGSRDAASGGTSGSGGNTSTVDASISTGGTPGTGGAATGGTPGTGGRGTGGSGTGGSGTGGSGTGGSGTGGSGTGGSGMGGSGTGGSGTGGSGTGGSGTGGGTGGCQKGQIGAQEVIIMGESFYAISPQYIEKRVEADAQAAGALAAGATYRNVAVSGQALSYIASTEWNSVSGTVKVVIMDGGAVDCMSSPCASCPDTFNTLLTKMASKGVQDVIYTRYPEPGNPPGSNTTLKGNYDILMPQLQTVCAAATGLRCHWVDLRPVWVVGDVLDDGLHPTQSGGNHVGDAIWAEMVKDCIAQ